MKNIKAVAYYLPQFHPIEENDKWWGKGFTEWTNVGKAKKYFKNHYQPRVPKDLGYYDLRVSETRIAQAEMAKEHGIDAFCYWHYWFGNGKRLLERPFQEVFETGEPDFPFCLGWANESWKGFEHGLKNRNVLMEQKYPGIKDFEDHFYTLIDSFKDERYLCINDKIVFVVYRPFDNILIKDFIETWRTLSKKNNLKDFYFIGHINSVNSSYEDVLKLGFDAVNTVRVADFTQKSNNLKNRFLNKINRIFLNRPYTFSYSKAMNYFFNKEIDMQENVIPSIVTGWDHSPRSGREGLILDNYNPEIFEKHLDNVFENVSNKENKIVFVKSWNEWAEGNYLEPDMKYGLDFLKTFKKNKDKYNKNIVKRNEF